MTKLILMRHGETQKNVSGLLHGRSDSSVLTFEGRRQTKKTARFLKESKIDVVYSSLEARALKSAKIISHFCLAPLHEVPGLEERDWGIFESGPWSRVEEILNEMSLKERYLYKPRGGESWKVFEERVVSTVNKLLVNNLNKTIVVVTHGGVIRVLLPHLLRVPREESFKHDPRNGSLTVFDYDGLKFNEVMLDNVDHLR